VDRAIGEFKDALNEKGEALLRYNIYVLRLGEQYDAFLDTQARLAQLNEKDEPLSPIWLGQVSHLARLYQEQMEESLKTISMLQRKYAYMTLDHSDPIDFVAGMDSLWQDGPSPTSENMNQLIGRVDRLVERLDGYDSDQSGGLTPLPDNENQRGALFVHIKPGPLLERFKQTWTISFVTTPDIAPLEPLTAAADAAPLPPAELPKIELEAAPPVPVIGCDRYHDIRVSHARARIYGATVRGTNTRIHIDVRTGKRSTIIDADGVPHTFFHRIERATSVEHTPDPKFDALDNSDMGAGHVGKLTDTAHDMIGLFTRWTLSVPLATHTSGPNFGLDLSGITGITLHFDVLARD
jgi:hypothetical protein